MAHVLELTIDKDVSRRLLYEEMRGLINKVSGLAIAEGKILIYTEGGARLDDPEKVKLAECLKNHISPKDSAAVKLRSLGFSDAEIEAIL